MSEHITPVPGDPSTEPVATAEQSHVDGRVGPPTIAQDADAQSYAPDHVGKIAPGAVMPADTAFEGGPIAVGDYAGPGPERPTAADAAAADSSLLGQNAAADVEDQAGKHAGVDEVPVKPAPGDSVVAEPVTAPAPSTTAAAPASTPTTDARG